MGKHTLAILGSTPDRWDSVLLRELVRVNSSYWEYVLANHVEIAGFERTASDLKQEAFELASWLDLSDRELQTALATSRDDADCAASDAYLASLFGEYRK